MKFPLESRKDGLEECVLDIRMQSHTGLVREFVDYLRERKTYWLAPLIFVLLMLATLGFFLEGSVVAPAIYSIF